MTTETQLNSNRKYLHTEKGKIALHKAQAKYYKTDKGKASLKRYYESKGKEFHRLKMQRYRAKKKEESK